jgi:hypothetical protein
VAAGFGGVAGAAGIAGGRLAALSGGVLVSDCTDPEGLAFTPPGIPGWSAVGFGSPSGGGDEGDLVSSGIARERGKPLAQKATAKNVNFYQLEGMVSTRERAFKISFAVEPMNKNFDCLRKIRRSACDMKFLLFHPVLNPIVICPVDRDLVQ